MKIYLFMDMEGISGMNRREMCWYWNEDSTPEDHQEGKEMLTLEANVAAQTALDAGAEQVIINLAHGGSRVDNFLRDKLIQDPRVTTCHPINQIVMPGIDETFDGVIFLGLHAMASTPDTFLPHTINSQWTDVRINGQSVGECGLQSTFAAHFDVPVLMTHGDSVACEQAKELFPWAVSAPVKRPMNFDRCKGDAEEGRQLTALKVREAIDLMKTGGARPWKPELPITLSVRYKNPDMAAEVANEYPDVELVENDLIEMRISEYNKIMTITVYQRDLNEKHGLTSAPKDQK